MSLEIKKKIEEYIGNDWEFIALSIVIAEMSLDFLKKIYLSLCSSRKSESGVEDGK